jgi:hypothetical protein
MTFWIDALSINQANVQEQNHQVQMMRQIYSKAHSAWIWLGEADTVTESDLAMQFIESQGPTFAKDLDSSKFWKSEKVRAIYALLVRTYWRRIWIVQEVLLAQKATILCGSKQVHWAKLSHLITSLQANSNRGRSFHTFNVLRILDTPAAVIVRAKSNWDGSPQPLTKLLKLYHRQQSTDIRDKVYALHGLASDSDGIAVDYTIDPKDLLVEVIYHACLDASQSKNEIRHFATMMRCNLHCTSEELPSHITVARGEGIEEVYRLSRRSSKGYDCFNEECDASFRTTGERIQHMRRHMQDTIQALGPTEGSGQKKTGYVEIIDHRTREGLEFRNEEGWIPKRQSGPSPANFFRIDEGPQSGYSAGQFTRRAM